MRKAQAIEVPVLMDKPEAESILARLEEIMIAAGVTKFNSYEWLDMYDLTENDKIIGFVSDDVQQTYQIDVVQLNDGSGYAFNFWKANYFFGQIVTDNSWEAIQVITD